MRVALIEPGAIATEIWRKADESFDGDRRRAAARRAPRATAGSSTARARRAGEPRATRSRADKVAAAVEHALTARRPRAHYMVGADARGQALIERLPASARDRLLRLALGI